MSIHDSRDLPLEPRSTDLRTNLPDPIPGSDAALPRPGDSLSPLGKRLAVLLRCHEAAGWHNMWLWLWWGIRAIVVLGVTIPLGIGIGNAVSALYLDYRPNYEQARILGWAAGIGTGAVIALLWAIFEWLWPKRFRALEEQIAAIQRDHAKEVNSWGGPAVLREPAVVAEILRLETHR